MKTALTLFFSSCIFSHISRHFARHISCPIFSTTLLCFGGYFLAACGMATSENVTYVIVTGQPPTAAPVSQQQVIGPGGQADAATLSPLPSPTPPDLPTAAPTADPQTALAQGDRALQNGYIEIAIQSYQAILERTDVPTDVRAAAAYNLGLAAAREGLFDLAVTALDNLIALSPGDLRAAQALVVRGDAYLGLSQWAAAIADYQAYLAVRPGVIDSYIYERIGDAQLALGQFPEAITSYQQATLAERSTVPGLALREKVARVQLSSGQVDSALAQYEAILAAAQNAGYRADIEFRAASALLEAGQTDLALERFARIFDEYERFPQAYQALEVLQANNRPVDALVRGRVSYYANDFAQAIEAFNAYTSQVSLGEVPAELHLLLGRAYREMGNSEAALIAFQTIVTQYPTDPLFGEALLEQGRTRFLAGDVDAAITQYQAIAANYASLTGTAAEALWRAGYLHATNNRPNESSAIFEQLTRLYPDSDQARSGLQIAASAALANGNTQAAETLFGQIAAASTGTDAADAYLQLGRLALRRGDQILAQQAFDQAVAAAPDSYYSARAADLLNGRAPFTPPTQFNFTFDELAEVTTAENWLRQTFGIAQDGPLWPLAPEVEANPSLMRGRELWTLGDVIEAEVEFVDALEAYEANPLASYQLAIFFRSIGAFFPSMQGAANVITTAGVGTLEAPAYLARLRYPAYYRDEVLRVAQAGEIDPLLIFSLIRHESLFDTTATAAAGEKGLTQVIPDTAAYIAQQLDWPDYQHSDLFRPYAGIEFGAYFLDENLERFDQNVYAALAGYNAGPGRAQQWLQIAGNDPDLFMSNISISSTQLYVQLIYRNYNIYRALYGVN